MANLKPYYDHAGIIIYEGHILTVLESMEPESVQMCVTSPPYWGLRDYGLEPQIWDAVDGCDHLWGDTGPEHHPGQVQDNKAVTNENAKGQTVGSGQFCQLCGAWRGSLGLEPSIELYVEHLVQIFRGVKRVLRKDGTLWLNLGDSFAGSPSGNPTYKNWKTGGIKDASDSYTTKPKKYGNLKPKDLCMIPARVALALQQDGWWLRSGMPWVKRSAMPESATDRPTSALEYMFMLTKSAKYYFDMEAIKVKYTKPLDRWGGDKKKTNEAIKNGSYHASAHRERDMRPDPNGRNFRNTDLFFESIKEPHGMIFCGDEMVGMDVNPKGYKEAHFATFPPKLIEPCIKAGTSEHGCCSKCGSPWERVVEKSGGTIGSGSWNYSKEPMVHMNRGKDLSDYQSKTIGWQPTCKCFGVSAEQTAWDVQMGLEEYNPIPCTVLDPFGGSMTTAYVAKELGRKAVMIDLSKEYIEMGIDRLKQDVLPFN